MSTWQLRNVERQATPVPPPRCNCMARWIRIPVGSYHNFGGLDSYNYYHTPKGCINIITFMGQRKQFPCVISTRSAPHPLSATRACRGDNQSMMPNPDGGMLNGRLYGCSGTFGQFYYAIKLPLNTASVSFQNIRVEIPLEVRAAAVGNFVHAFIDPINQLTIQKRVEPLGYVFPIVPGIVGNHFRTERHLRLIKGLKNPLIRLRHPIHIRSPSHNHAVNKPPLNTPDHSHYLNKRGPNVLSLRGNNSVNVKLELSSWTHDILSNDCSGPGSNLSNPKRTPKGPAVVGTTHCMRRNNDRGSKLGAETQNTFVDDEDQTVVQEILVEENNGVELLLFETEAKFEIDEQDEIEESGAWIRSDTCLEVAQ